MVPESVERGPHVREIGSLVPGRVKLMTRKCILVASKPGARHFSDRACLIGSVWDIRVWSWWPGLPVGQHYKATVTSQYLSDTQSVK